MESHDREFHRVLDYLKGIKNLRKVAGRAIREAIDRVINGRYTGRYSIEQLDKTEKTYIGTAVEHALLYYLDLEKDAPLDTKIDGIPVDIKFTVGQNWMIPEEAVNQLCLLVSADESKGTYELGLVRASSTLLHEGGNKDKKRSFSKKGKESVYWLVKNGPLSNPLILTLSEQDRMAIMSQNGGTLRMAELFRRCIGKVVDGVTVETVGQQRDSSKRIRSDGGARDLLIHEGIRICSHYDNDFLEEQGYPRLKKGEFMSVRIAKHKK
jgi:hypothetical protein